MTPGRFYTGKNHCFRDVGARELGVNEFLPIRNISDSYYASFKSVKCESSYSECTPDRSSGEMREKASYEGFDENKKLVISDIVVSHNTSKGSTCKHGNNMQTSFNPEPSCCANHCATMPSHQEVARIR